LASDLHAEECGRPLCQRTEEQRCPKNKRKSSGNLEEGFLRIIQ